MSDSVPKRRIKGTRYSTPATPRAPSPGDKEGGVETPRGRRRNESQQRQSSRRRTPATGAVKKPRISPKRAATQVIPGRKIPNGKFVALPKGSMMELIQVRDLEINRLMEELVDYEEEAVGLTHQLHVANKNLEAVMFQNSELEKEMRNAQAVSYEARLHMNQGPKIMYKDDRQIAELWNKLLDTVSSFASTHSKFPDEDTLKYTPINKFVEEATSKKEIARAFNAMVSDDQYKDSPTRIYIDKITDFNPSRLDIFLAQGTDLVVMAIIMRILTEEVFDKFRFLIRSEPFWNPMKTAGIRVSGKSKGEEVSITEFYCEDILVEHEARSVDTPDVAFEFNALRAKMILHLVEHERRFGTILSRYLDRVGILITNAIRPLISTQSLIVDRWIGREDKKSVGGTNPVTLKDLFDPEDRTGGIDMICKILATAGTLALLMRSDHTICYLDSGGLNMPYNGDLMTSAAKYLRRYSTWEPKYQELLDRTENTFAFLVVAPALKRAGGPSGKGYNHARVLCRSQVYLMDGTPEDYDGAKTVLLKGESKGEGLEIRTPRQATVDTTSDSSD